MTPDITSHYPPDLFNFLVDAIPLLNKTKKDLLLFFKGAGVADDILRDLQQRLKVDPKNIGKFQIARTVLQRLNERGEGTLGERREVLRRVVEFPNFDACWPDDQLKAKGQVDSVRRWTKADCPIDEMHPRAEWEDAENVTNRTVKAPPKTGQNAAPGGISRPQLALRGTSLEH